MAVGGVLIVAAIGVAAAWFSLKTSRPTRPVSQRSEPIRVVPKPTPEPAATVPATKPEPPPASEKLKPEPPPVSPITTPPVEKAASAEKPMPEPVKPDPASPASPAGDQAARPAPASEPTPPSITPEALTEKIAQLVESAPKATDAERIQSLVEASGVALAEAVSADRLDLAQTLSVALGRVSIRTGAKEYRAEIRQQRDQVEYFERYWPDVQEALETLKQNTDDPEANEVLGQWTCLVKWDWARGLPYLAKAADVDLKAIAAQEQQAGVADPVEKVKLADAWLEYAKHGKPLARDSGLSRAAYWYRRASAGLADEVQQKAVEKRLDEVRRQLPPADELAETITNSVGMKLVRIRPGEFRMGSSPEDIAWCINYAKSHYRNAGSSFLKRFEREGPARTARIPAEFYLGAYEVTQKQFEDVLGRNPSKFTSAPAGEDARQLPVENVVWTGAVEFCARLSASPRERAARREYRLPSEAEWEYACRAGSARDEFSVSRVWCESTSGRVSHAVGLKPANAWGLYDMLGNVGEWCLNRPDEAYFLQLPPSATPASADPRRTIRGGSWRSMSLCCRAPFRTDAAENTRQPDVGFRVACMITPVDRKLAPARKPREVKRSRPPTPAKNKPAAPPAVTPLAGVIVEGLGIGPFRIGASKEMLVRALGMPDNPTEERYPHWEKQFVSCVYDRSLGVVELHFNRGCTLPLTSGVRLGSTSAEILARYGRPDRVRPAGDTQGYEYSARGLILCVDKGDVLIQIVVFAGRRSR
jgi:formylglycine-generating enzyme required for sulfatase activity